jgi:hypothetical protein
MRLALVVFLLVATGLFTKTAKADPLTVGQLVARCGKLDLSENNQIRLRSASIGDALDGGKCWGHLEAYMDLAVIELPDGNKPNGTHPLGVCPPYKNNISFTELAQMFLQYAGSHPSELQKPAALIVANLLAQKFPCHK